MRKTSLFLAFAAAAVLISDHALAQAAPAAPPANGAVLPPTQRVLLADCPKLKQVVLTIPVMDPTTGTQATVYTGGAYVPQVVRVDYDYVPSYGGGGKCFGKEPFAVEVWDAAATKSILDAYRDEVLDALKAAVTAAAIRDDQLTVLKSSIYDDLNVRVAAPLLKEISALKTRIAELEAAQATKGKK
jgi:hypothetical protein